MSNEVIIQYKKYRTRNRLFIVAMLILLVLVGCVALVAGSHQIGWQEIVALMRGEGIEMNRQILLNIPFAPDIGCCYYRDYSFGSGCCDAGFVT